MSKSFAQTISPRIAGIAKRGVTYRNDVQSIIAAVFDHAADCGDYSFLSRLTNAVGSQERKQIIAYIVEHTENIRWNVKTSAFVKTAKRKSLSFNCAAIAKVTWYDWAKENEEKIVDYDKLFVVTPSKSHDKKIETGTVFTGDLDAMLVRRAALAKLAAMSDAELAAFAGDNVVKLDVAA